MAIRRSQIEATRRYKERHYWRAEFFSPSGREKDIKARAESLNLSVNAYMNKLIRDDLGMTEEEWKARDDGDQQE